MGSPSSAEPAAALVYRAEAAWHDRDERAAVVAESRRVLADRVDEPYAYLAWSLTTLADGYKNGDRFQADNYLRGSLRAATELAELGLDRAPGVALSHAHRAFLYLVSGDLDGAQRELASVRQLQPVEFHSALYAAVLAHERGQSGRVDELLAEAESSATHLPHYTLLNRIRVRIAQSDGDRSLEERLHLQNIELNSGSAHAHGSYAHFLLGGRRDEEALARYEQAVAIQRYPAAVRGLERARLRMSLSRPETRRSHRSRGLALGLAGD